MVQTPPRATPRSISPLENGDRLSRDEFESRYAAMPKDCKAERIEGIVYMAAALRFRSHGLPHSHLNSWITTYSAFTPCTFVADAPSVRMNEDNDPQPDIILILDPALGGQTRITDDDYIEGAPELIAEISASTVSIDLGAKKNVYERNGVQEYLVWRVLDQELDWFILEAGHYIPLAPDADGITRSRIFPGLWLDTSALLNSNLKQVLATVNQGTQSPVHQAFLEQLKPMD